MSDYGWLPQIDMSPLTSIGQGLANRRQNNRLGDALGALGPDASLEDMARALQGIDPKLALKTMIEARQAQALEAHRQQQLVPDDLRLLQGLRGYGATSPTVEGGGSPVEVGGGELPGFITDKFKSTAEKTREEVRVKHEEESAADKRGKAAGASRFLAKVGQIESFLDSFGDEADGLFGPLQGNEYYQGAARVMGTKASAGRERLKALLRDLELDVAQMKLKGTGPVTEAERAIARETLPQGTTQDAKTARDILNALKLEAHMLTGQGGLPSPQSAATPPSGGIVPRKVQTVPIPPPVEAGAGVSPVSTDMPQVPAAIGKARQAMELGASPEEIGQALIADGVPQDVVQQIVRAIVEGPNGSP
jgi:hypothetical protein